MLDSLLLLTSIAVTVNAFLSRRAAGPSGQSA